MTKMIEGQETVGKVVDEQGRSANRNGKWLERQVEETLVGYGIPSLKHSQVNKKFGKKIMSQNVPGFLLKNVFYTNMFGSESNGEFVLQITNKGPVRIECRYQRVRGSVDEKVPYLIGNCLTCEEKNVILVIEGEGMRKSALAYAINASRAIAHKNIKVMNLSQFKVWAKKMFGPVDPTQTMVEYSSM